jgi:hypothetical protein
MTDIARYEVEVDGSTIVNIGLPPIVDGKRRFNVGPFLQNTPHQLRGRSVSPSEIPSAWTNIASTNTMTAFDPMSNPKLWAMLKADTFTLADGTAAPDTGQWTDTSGNGNHGYIWNPSGLMQIKHNQLNGHKAVRFQGGNYDYIGLPDMSPLTAGEIFIILKETALNDPGTGHRLGATGDDDIYPLISNGKIYAGFGSTVRKNELVSQITILNNWHLYNAFSATNSWGLFQNAISVHQTSSNAVGFSPNPKLFNGSGGGQPFTGLCSLVVVFDDKLTDTERSGMRTWLDTQNYM